MPEIKTLNGIISVDTNDLKQVCLDVTDDKSLLERELIGTRAWMTREGALELIEVLMIAYLDRGCPRFDKEKIESIRTCSLCEERIRSSCGLAGAMLPLQNWREYLALSREEFREWLDRLTKGEEDG